MIRDLIQEAQGILISAGVEFTAGRNHILVPATGPGGFETGLVVENGHYEVWFNKWHEDFQEPDVALRWFVEGLSGECRLREVRRGGVAHFWTVERREENGWIAGWSVGLFTFPFWRRKEVLYLRNSVLPSTAA